MLAIGSVGVIAVARAVAAFVAIQARVYNGGSSTGVGSSVIISAGAASWLQSELTMPIHNRKNSVHKRNCKNS